jgi:cell division septum initiation protein DivIVA
MATAKKPVEKKAPAKEVASKKVATKTEAQFSMPVEVKDWIDQASSRMNHMRTEIERLKEENKQLRRSHKLMEQRVMGMSLE